MNVYTAFVIMREVRLQVVWEAMPLIRPIMDDLWADCVKDAYGYEREAAVRLVDASAARQAYREHGRRPEDRPL